MNQKKKKLSIFTHNVGCMIVLIVFLIAIDLNWPELTPKPSQFLLGRGKRLLHFDIIVMTASQSGIF